MPPTTFFSAGRGDDENDDGHQVDAESILDLALSVFRPARRLRWHYRSRHGGLVAFSNREFYGDDLVVFPSPTEALPGQGVSTAKVNGVYRNRCNVAEATAICKAAASFMRQYPGRSLGLATLNVAQRDLILDEMDRLFTVHPKMEAYRSTWAGSLEPFFVKNLENIQGDERDAIFISTCFGSSKNGGRVAQNFGPINGQVWPPTPERSLHPRQAPGQSVHLPVTGQRDSRAGEPSRCTGPEVLPSFVASPSNRTSRLAAWCASFADRPRMV